MSAPLCDASPPMNTQQKRIHAAFTALENILHGMEWTFHRHQNPAGISTAYIVPAGTPVEIRTVADSIGRSLFLASHLPLEIARPRLTSFRRILERQALALNGLTLQFRPKLGVRLVSRFWIPAEELPPERIEPWLKPCFQDLLSQTNSLFPGLLKDALARPKPKVKSSPLPPRLRPSDDFYLPS